MDKVFSNNSIALKLHSFQDVSRRRRNWACIRGQHMKYETCIKLAHFSTVYDACNKKGCQLYCSFLISGYCVSEGHFSSKLLFYWLLFYLWLLYQILIQFTLNAKCEMKIIPVLFISAFFYAVSVFFIPVPGILELRADLNLSK